MKVSLVQAQLFWEDPNKNFEHLSQLIEGITEKTQLIVLPEMFSTGFTMNPENNAEVEAGPALTWLKKTAADKNCVVTGSVAVQKDGNYFNRLYWVKPSGEYSHYDKRHLFRMGTEDQHYAAGNEKIIEEIQETKFCPLVCYDLRFPVWSRNKFDKQNSTWTYDVLIYVANWPAVRTYPWKHLLIARAIENQCYVIGVNRVGDDGNLVPHTGNSVVINAKGEIISSIEDNKEGIQTISLDFDELQKFRKQFPVGLDADNFKI